MVKRLVCYLACLAVLAALFSRTLVAWGLAPAMLNFVHFPLAITAGFLSLAASRHGLTMLSIRIFAATAVLGFLSLLSWLANGGSFLKPILLWLLFVEPFIVISAIATTLDARHVRILFKVSMALAFVQLPFAFYQAAFVGLHDAVQGTLIGHGAGAHIAGAIALMAILVMLGRLTFYQASLPTVFRTIFIITLLFAIPILADAKQVIASFAIAVFFMIVSGGMFKRRVMLTTLLVMVIIAMGIILYPPLRMLFDVERAATGLEGKVMALEIIFQNMGESIPSLLMGLGPGQSVSRAALAAQEGYLRSIPEGLVSLDSSPVTSQILFQISESYFLSSSSVWSGISSWLGIFGDLGILGIIVYAFLLLSLWRELSRISSSQAAISKAILLMGVFLGLLSSWLEIPEFTLPWSLFLSLGLARRKT